MRTATWYGVRALCLVVSLVFAQHSASVLTDMPPHWRSMDSLDTIDSTGVLLGRQNAGEDGISCEHELVAARGEGEDACMTLLGRCLFMALFLCLATTWEHSAATSVASRLLQDNNAFYFGHGMCRERLP
ncbi:hypothetical protein EDB81DRAFT_106221 [Dactylonectria macrodidyma]|uniref:Uncharacterized protein n=1 Tax=Dactylonectria macrodidyma TaxID=307937 RepID=A0A9P9IWI5_9HYPO|nr:hypothetical protein EDB81DRAFT_106221 [Dactylonectria macrodidyma]